MPRIALLVALSLLAAMPLAPVASASQNPFCEWADFLCTIYETTTRTVQRVCDAAIQGGCPEAHG